MGIKDKQTYGEYYWAMQLEAQNAFYEDVELGLAGHFRSLLSDIVAVDKLDPGIKSFFMEFIEPTAQWAGAVGLRFASEIGDMIAGEALHPYARVARQALEAQVLSNVLSPAQASILNRRKKILPELYDTYMHFGGYPDIQSRFLYQALESYPSIPDLILYSRYNGDPENVWSTLQEFYDIDPVDFKLWKWLGLQRLTTDQVTTLHRRGILHRTELNYALSQIGWQGEDFDPVVETSYTIPTAMLLIQGGLMHDRPDDQLLADIVKADIHPDYAQTYMDAVLTKPATSDIIAYELRRDPDLSNLATELRKIGTHPAYASVLTELAHIIPPTGDLITMAVREAFTPDIAARFGQYEDFPPEFAHWAAKKGLTEDWSKRYWAAHWSLPSTTQGFEMLHRGVINQTELNMLLRALDIMPFWRDKLTQVAYRRLSRVDIRRMYRLGVLDETQVYDAYLELGYNDRDARRMSDFTVRQTLATQSKFTSRDIITAYSKRMITRAEARSLLIEIGVKSENIGFIISTADYKRQWAYTNDRIAGIRNLYRKRVYDENKTRSELLRLDLPSEQVDVLMEQWYFDKETEPDRTWTTAQTLGFIEAKFISRDRGIAELRKIGYDNEHIDVYLRSMK